MRNLKIAVALAFASAPTAAYAEWWEARSDHFIVFAEGKEADTKAFAERLERFDNALRYLQKLPIGKPVPDAAKVTVYRFGDTFDIGRLAGGRSVAGFYIPRAARPVVFTPAKEERQLAVRERADPKTLLKPEVVLFHEYTHHFMLRNFNAAYPSWYVEGFAELNSTIDLRDNGSFALGLPANHRSSELFRMDQVPVKRMLDPANRVDTIEEQLTKYSLGWLLIHNLTFSKSRSGQLLQYLKAVGAGENSLTAAERIFGDLGKLNGELQKYKSSNLPAIEVVPPNYSAPKIVLRKLTAAEEKTIRKEIQLSRGVSRSQARSIDRELAPIAAAEPKNYTAQILSAEAALDARNFAVATASANRALALKPNSVDALVYKARALFEAKEGDAARFAEARSLLDKAMTIDPEDPRPLIETYNAWRKSGAAIPEDGAIALEAAFPLAAHDRTYRIILTRHLLEQKRYPAARQVLAPLAFSYDGRDPKDDVAGIALASLDANKPEEALAKLNRELAKAESDDD